MSPGRPRLLPAATAPLDARVEVPTSKSLTNRALILAAVADGAEIERPLDCEDTRLLADALEGAGWPVSWGHHLVVGRRRPPGGRVHLHLGNSGTGSRLMLALVAAVPGSFVVDGSARLRERPMRPLLDALSALGADLESPGGCLPVRVEGRRLEGGPLSVRPRVSSQFVSALLMIGPLLARGLELRVEGPIPSRPYLDLTEQVLRAGGVRVEHSGDGRRWRVPPGPPRVRRLTVEGDWSAAAFFLAAASVAGGRVTVEGVDGASRQGDRRLVELLATGGVRMTTTAGGVVAEGPRRLPVTADLEGCPDLFPALCAAAACGPPGSRLTGLEHLRHKESDRLGVMVDNLRALGAELSVGPGELRVTAAVERRAEPRKVTAAGDHRIAMAMAVTALASGPLELDDPECVQKSFPGFWAQWAEISR